MWRGNQPLNLWTNRVRVHGFKGSGVQAALASLRRVQRDVAMKLLSHSMGLAFHHPILTCQVWAKGCILVAGLHLGCVFTRKAAASSVMIQNLEPNWQLFGKMSILNDDFGFLMSFFVLNSERWTLNLWTVTIFWLLRFVICRLKTSKC